MKVEPWFDKLGWLVRAQPAERIFDVGVPTVIDLLGARGAILLRGFSVDEADFVAYSAEFQREPCPHVFASSIRPPLSADGTVVDVFAGDDVVSLHGEMYFLPRHPDLIWFYCIQPSREGGQTTVCDGVAFLAALGSLREAFERQSVVYSPVLPADGWRKLSGRASRQEAERRILAMKGVRRLESVARDSLRIEYVSSAITTTRLQGVPAFVNSILNVTEERYLSLNLVRCTFEDGMPFSRDMLDALERAGESVTREVSWQPGDLLLIDNSRMQHGRRRFRGERRMQTRHSMALH